MRILISGGGIAGLTLAYWLHHHGFTPVVVERAAPGRGDGYGIDFHGTGYDIAARMGITDALTPRQLPIDTVDFVDSRGRTTSRLGKRLLEKIIRGPHLALMHSTLEHTLAQTVAPIAEIRYEQTITAIESTPDRVTATFDTGATEDFDLLIGADGVHSRTRRLAFGDESRFVRHLGHYVASHPVPDEFELGRARVHHTRPGRQVVVYPSDTPGQLIALYLFRAPDTGPVPRAERASLLRRRYADVGWLTPRLLSHAPDDLFMDTMAQVHMPRWHHDRVALVGDACGCMSLVSAQGVSMAMAGAYVLADALRHAPDHGTAFARYQQRMRPQVVRRQSNARLFAASLVPASRLGLAGQELAARVVMRDAFAGLLRSRFGVASILPSLDNDHPVNRR